jgi:hypothetical protein
MPINIPARIHPALARIATMPDPVYSAIGDALAAMPIMIDPQNIDEYRKLSKVALDAESFRDIVSVGLSLSVGRQSTGLSTEAFVDQVVTQTVAAEAVSQTEPLRSRLLTLLSMPSFEVGAKALDLLFETERHISDVRILTDLRPVFSDSAVEVPKTSLVIHTLKIDFHEGEQSPHFFASLDLNDLRKLQKAVSRAIEKDSTLRKALNAAGFNVIDTPRHEHGTTS